MRMKLLIITDPKRQEDHIKKKLKRWTHSFPIGIHSTSIVLTYNIQDFTRNFDVVSEFLEIISYS